MLHGLKSESYNCPIDSHLQCGVLLGVLHKGLWDRHVDVERFWVLDEIRRLCSRVGGDR